MADSSALSRLVPAVPGAATDVAAAAASLWLLVVAGVAAPAAALAAGPRPPTTVAGATQVLLVALAPPALAYVPYVLRREVRPAVDSGRGAAAVATGAAVAAVAAVWGGGVAHRALAPSSGLPVLGLVLPAFGVWLHRRGRATGDPGAWAARTLPSRADLQRPRRLVADPRKAGNAALVGAHAVVLAAAANLAWRLAARGSAGALLLAAAVVYGGWYVGQAFVVRAGVWEPWQRP